MQTAKPECNTRYFIFRENVEQIATAKIMLKMFPGILVKVKSIRNSLKVNLICSGWKQWNRGLTMFEMSSFNATILFSMQ